MTFRCDISPLGLFYPLGLLHCHLESPKTHHLCLAEDKNKITS
jgi:hypothetical protein